MTVLNEKAYTLREESKNRKHSAIVPYNYGSRSYGPFYNDSDAYYKNRSTNKIITNSSAQDYVQHVNGQWVPHQSKIIVPKSTNLDKVYLAVYDSMKKGKPNHHILEAATFCFNGHTNAKYDYIKEGNESYVLSDMNVKGIKVPVEVYTMSAKDYDELKKVILPALTQQEQYIVSIDNNYKNGRLCKMFFYPTDKAELTFDSLTYIEAF